MKKVSKTVDNYSKLIRRASKIEDRGLLGAILAPRQLRTAKMMFLGRSPEGTLLEAFSVHVAIQRRPDVENLGFWGGLVAEFLLKRFCVTFGRVLGSEKVNFAWEG